MAADILSQIQIDRYSPVPIYRQLQAQLEALITSGACQPQEPLPSDNALAQTLHISVMTVRQAMGLLVSEGLIYREKGRGTFIMPHLLDHHLQRLEGFSEDMRARGLKPHSRILIFEQRTPSEGIARRLGIEPDAVVTYIKRLRLADERPVAVHDAYLNHRQITRSELEKIGSLYELLERTGVQLLEADETLEAGAADDEIAALLGIEPGAPVLIASRLSWDHLHAPVEWVRAVYRADFYRYAVRLRRG